MSKLWIIIKREFLTRVMNKSFLLVTFLTPIGFGLLMFGIAYLSVKSMKADSTVLVLDESPMFSDYYEKTKNVNMDFSDQSLEQLKGKYDEMGYELLVHIPPYNVEEGQQHQVFYYSEEMPGLQTLESIESEIAQGFRKYRIEESNLDEEILNSLRVSVNLENGEISEDSETKVSGKLSVIISTALGYIMGFMMYMVIFIFGGLVMRSVMEEKINRIVEVIISSVKPFELMLGKLVGVGAVALTQLLIWLIFIPIIMTVVTLVIPGADPASMSGVPSADIAAYTGQEPDFLQILAELKTFNWWLIIPGFIVFFLLGYFLYSSMFAAIGSTIDDDMGQAQQLMLPIIIPVIFAFIIMQTSMQNPNSGLAVFGSLFPLFSPIVMPARLAFSPPVWQIVTSIVLLIGTTVFFTWLAGRIYRVGILMYGKKVTFREMMKWLTYKG